MAAFVIVGARVFDGERVLGLEPVLVDQGRVVQVGGETPDGVEQIEGGGATLMPGLLDAHVHTEVDTLGIALRFGVTTELDLMSVPEKMRPVREQAAQDMRIADVRSASFALTSPNGHPHQLRKGLGDPVWPTVDSPDHAAAWVEGRLDEGADYIKLLAEDGKALNSSLPTPAPEIYRAVTDAAHERGLMVLAHAYDPPMVKVVLDAGVDGLAHLMATEPLPDELLAQIVEQGVFVIPTLVVAASAASDPAGRALADDPRVQQRLPREWQDNLRKTFDFGWDLQVSLASLRRLHEAGVEVLVGTDAAHLGVPGLAHGASTHDEMRLLVQVGLSPTEALRSATSLTAQRFGLHDRGRITGGATADLLLVDGDPTQDISHTLDIRGVWRGGERLDS